MTYFFDTLSLPRKELAPGISLRIISGEKVMMSIVEIAPHAVLLSHTHPHEQAGLVLEGMFEFTIGGERRMMKPGDSYMIPGGVEHSLIGSEGWSLALDVFSPPRREYL